MDFAGLGVHAAAMAIGAGHAVEHFIHPREKTVEQPPAPGGLGPLPAQSKV